MGNRFYQPGEARAARVNDLFEAIAPRYDLINDLQSFGLHRWWKRRLLQLAEPAPGRRVLDLCCGTGDVALALAARGAEVVGLDFSAAMLKMAIERASKASTHNQANASPIQWVRGDAQNIPFPADTFDVVTVAYGLRNLADWRRGLEEMLRVTRAGGRLLVLEFGKPDLSLWRHLYFLYLRWMVPVFGRLFCGDAETYGYILESLRHYPAQHGVATWMEAVGCEKIEIIQFLGGIMTINLGCKPKTPPVDRIF